MSEPGQKLGEVLRTAREARGVDVARVERDTKIRARYVEALERGDYRELPGAVYTKGFLRNYGLYLGLDPEDLIDLYRLESRGGRVERPTAPTPPRPLGRRRRGVVVEPGVLVAAILTIVVVALVVYLGYELITFARTPTLRITEPAGDIGSWTEESFTVRGVTAANARIDIAGLTENPSATADAQGNFEVTVDLVPGSNVIDITAWDPQVSRTSDIIRRTITVAGPDPSTPPVLAQLTVQAPADDVTSTGSVPVDGSATPGAVVTVTPTLAAAAPATFAIVDLASNAPVSAQPQGAVAPAATSLAAASDGALTGELRLPPGTWDLAFATDDGASATRRVVITPPAGVTALVEVGAAASYLEIDVDGQPDARNGTIVAAGERISLAGQRELRILAGNAGAVSLTINGLRLGALGSPNAVVQWRITRTP